MNYIKQLDSLRAIAVLLVIIHHWFPDGHPLSTYTGFFNGVDIFFALSGFLITRILFTNRQEAEDAGRGMGGVIKQFYIRRTLRIFPVYYLLVAFLFLAGPYTGTGIRENVGYFLTYTSNFYFYKIDEWDGMLSHLWSLSVEEQFYLLWPWLMLFSKKKLLLPLILFSILLGTVSQILLYEHELAGLLTFACFDGFGLGALLAWLLVYQPAMAKRLRTPAVLLAIAACALQVTRVLSDNTILLLPSRTLTALCTCALILHLVLKKDSPIKQAGFLLNNRGLIFIGKISYGIYLYHLLVPHFVAMALYKFFRFETPAASTPSFYLLQIAYFGLLLLMAYASWKLVEEPILKYKERFSYHKPQQTPVVKVVTTRETKTLSQ